MQSLKENTVTIFTDGSSSINPGPTGAGAVIFRAGMNEPPTTIEK